MAHRSWCAEHPGHDCSNERLEFLGDAVLGWVVADLAFRRFPELPEGELTDVRKGVVNATALADGRPHARARRVPAARPGRGRRRRSRQAVDPVRRLRGRDRRACTSTAARRCAYGFVERLVGPGLAETAARLDHLDHKSRLQELAVRAGVRAAELREPRRAGPTTTSASSPQAVGRRARCSARAPAARRRWPSRPRPQAPPTSSSAAGPSADRRPDRFGLELACPSCPRSRPSGAGSPTRSSAGGSTRVEVGRRAHGAPHVGPEP